MALSRMQLTMFGRPDWFKTRTVSFRTPATFLGWLYTAGWSAAIGIPTWMFLDSRRVPEAACWFAISSLALMWDRRHSRKTATASPPPVIASSPEIIHEPPRPAAPAPAAASAKTQATESPFYISDAQPDITFVAERNRQPGRSWMPWARRFRV